jgi:hypothetical protein
MYAQLEEDHRLAKQSMAMYNGDTQVVNDDNKFKVCAIQVFFITPLYYYHVCKQQAQFNTEASYLDTQTRFRFQMTRSRALIVFMFVTSVYL